MDATEAIPDELAELVGIAREIQELAIRGGWTLATAESCTGGLVAHVLTESPGSSAYVRGAVVAYANDIKEAQLGVPAAVLEAHGAVSAQVAIAMADGVRDRLGTTLGVSVTGIAGPEGGTAAKPVGLTYVAVAGLGPTDVRRFVWAGDRTANKRESARAALELVLQRLHDAAVR
ncbi:MAG TPA: CinA family protein [Candidatus Limnocylindrales bacterium]|nr:CinA family protein [Candidatus Limnocylindrales bacterium]